MLVMVVVPLVVLVVECPIPHVSPSANCTVVCFVLCCGVADLSLGVCGCDCGVCCLCAVFARGGGVGDGGCWVGDGGWWFLRCGVCAVESMSAYVVWFVAVSVLCVGSLGCACVVTVGRGGMIVR